MNKKSLMIPKVQSQLTQAVNERTYNAMAPKKDKQ